MGRFTGNPQGILMTHQCCRCYFFPHEAAVVVLVSREFSRTLLHPLLSWSIILPLSVGYCRHHLYESRVMEVILWGLAVSLSDAHP